MTPEELIADPRTQPFTKLTVSRCQHILAKLGW
jgi:hypothetical protein